MGQNAAMAGPGTRPPFLCLQRPYQPKKSLRMAPMLLWPDLLQGGKLEDASRLGVLTTEICVFIFNIPGAPSSCRAFFVKSHPSNSPSSYYSTINAMEILYFYSIYRYSHGDRIKKTLSNLNNNKSWHSVISVVVPQVTMHWKARSVSFASWFLLWVLALPSRFRSQQLITTVMLPKYNSTRECSQDRWMIFLFIR